MKWLFCSTCAYFDNLKFDSFNAMFLVATLSRQYCPLADFHVSADTSV